MTDSLPKISRKTGGSRTAGDPAAFVESLSRLVKITSYYPGGHSVFEQAADVFRGQILAFESDRGVELRVDRSSCSIAGKRLEKLAAVGEEVRRLFFDVGLHRIVFHRNLTSKDLQIFFSLLMEWKLQARGAKELIELKSDIFPATIEVFQQEFVASKKAARRGRESGPEFATVQSGIDEICRSLVESGHNQNAVLQCRDFLIKVTGEQDDSGVEDVAVGEEEVSWENIIAMMSGLVRSIDTESSEANAPDDSDLQAISTVFQSYQDADDEGAHGAINLLLDLFPSTAEKKKNNGSEKKDRSTKKEQSGSEEVRVSSSQAEEDRQKAEESKQAAEGEHVQQEARKQKRREVRAFIKEKAIPVNVLKRLAIPDRGEELSILFQLYLSARKRDSQTILVEKICTIFTRKASNREKKVVMAALTDIIDNLGFESFFPVCRRLLESLHADGSSGGQRFLLDFARQMTPDRRALLWPFFVNEALFSGAADRASFTALVRFAAGTSRTAIAKSMTLLEGLDAFTVKRSRPRFFLTEEIGAYPLYAVLLTTSLAQEIARQVLEGLREQAQDTFIAPFALFLQPQNRLHLQFLRSYLFARAEQQKFAVNMHQEGGALLSTYLRDCEKSDINEEELAQIISLSGGVKSRKVVTMLERITVEKKMGFVFLWPGRCRKAAATVLAAAKRR